YGSTVSYFLKTAPSGRGAVTVTVTDKNGKTVREIRNPPALAGLNRVAWDLRWDPPVEPPQVATQAAGASGQTEAAGGGGRGGRGGGGGGTATAPAADATQPTAEGPAGGGGGGGGGGGFGGFGRGPMVDP